jgi:nucleoside-diphosphate-sugar epimerase
MMSSSASKDGPCALVTGGTGFIGSHLVAHLDRLGWRTHVLTRQGGRVAADERHHAADLEVDALAHLLGRIRPQVVFHLATFFVAEHQPGQVDALVQANIAFGARLLEAMRLSACPRLAYTASAWQYFDPDARAPVPTNLYAATKNAFECLVDYYAASGSLRALGLTLFDSYGPSDPRPKLLNLLLRRRDDEGPLSLSAGAQRICLVHVSDIVAALMRCADMLGTQADGSHERYTVGDAPRCTLRELVATLEAVRGRPLSIEWGAKPYREREVMEPWRGGQPLPGWAPQMALADGLAALLRRPSDTDGP